MNGRRVQGDTKPEAGTRTVILPAFLRRHLESYAEPGPDGLIFVGEKGAPFRRSTFGRKWLRAREVVGMPEDFRFYDLRHTGHTLSTRSGATLNGKRGPLPGRKIPTVVLARIWHATSDRSGQQNGPGL